MKRKLLFAALCVVSVLGLRAQTDVTSKYITNADFEGEYSVFQNLNSGSNARAIYKPEGWTVNYSNSESNDITALDANSLQWNNFSSRPQPTNGGNKTYWIRFRWGSTEILTLSQTVTLQAGKYCFSADAFFNGASGASAKISANSNSTSITGNSTWSNYEVNFVLASETSVTFSLNLIQTQQIENIAGFDNFKLTYTAVVVKDILETAITAATNANATLSNSDLATAISTAQGVYDDADATQEQVNSAAATLNAAVELAMSAAGDVTTIFLANPGFESSTETTTNAAATGSAAPLNIGGDWTQTSSAAWSSSAVVTYGGSGQVNGVSAPSADNADNTGKTLGVSVGWDGLVTYKSKTVTLPAGVYTLKVYGYNALSGVTQFASKFGFVPTSGTSTLSTKTAFAYGTWEEDKVTLTLNEATEGVIQVGGQAISGGSGSNAKVFFDNISITYSSFLAGAKAAWEEAKDAAVQAKTDCPNVTGEELTALNAELAKAEPTTVAGYNEATAAIEAATATFTAAKGVYDAYAEIRGVAVALGVTPGDAPASAAAAPAATHTLNVAVYTATTADNIFDVTDVYAPSWSSMNTSSGQYWSGDTNISYADEWRGDTNPTTRTATVTLPAGRYILMSAGRGSDNTVPTMSANGTTVTFATNGDMGLGINKAGAASFDAEDAAGFANKSGAAENTGTGWEWRYIPVTLDEETAVTVTQTLTRLSGNAWGSFCDFRILKKGVLATADDYAALSTAIEKAEAYTLGFDASEYAPYNNVAALKALAAAKAFDQTAKNEKETVETVTASLTTAIWTPNDGDVDAIYNGMYATVAAGANYPDGWTRTNGWGQMRSELEGNFATAYYNQPGSLQYGNQGIYTMPLAANTAYQLTFSYRSHENESNQGITVSVLNGEDGMPAATFTKNGSTSEWADATAYFTTGAAGNYVLTLANGGNTWMTNVSLVKFEHAASIDLTEEEGLYRNFDRTYAQNVTVKRTVKAGFNTVCMPFDMTAEQVADVFGENAKVYEFSENSADANDVTINFNTKSANTIEANVPVLIGDATASTETKTFNNVMFKSGEAKVVGTNTIFVAVYTPTTVAEGDYFVGNGALYKSKGSTDINAFRAYIDATEEATVKMFINDLETAIDGINADAPQNGAIFNLAGQRVNKAQKGIYIVNGKKVLVK